MNYLSLKEMKNLYPDEWVLIGKPEINQETLEITAGYLLFHSKDKKEVCYLGREKTKDYKPFSLIYTGELKNHQRRITGIFNRLEENDS